MSFVRIGAKPADGDLVDLLLECHSRIRSFIGIARRLADAEAATDDEIRDAATRVHRYFSEALPLHVADEDETVAPRLKGRDQNLDEALDRMSGEHQDHSGPLGELIDVVAQLRDDPGRHAELRGALAPLAERLEREFEQHLAQEEADVLPALRARLSKDTLQQMADEVRERRNPG